MIYPTKLATAIAIALHLRLPEAIITNPDMTLRELAAIAYQRIQPHETSINS
jgi:hypothetical protein